MNTKDGGIIKRTANGLSDARPKYESFTNRNKRPTQKIH
jgi:hypothetical protein